MDMRIEISGGVGFLGYDDARDMTPGRGTIMALFLFIVFWRIRQPIVGTLLLITTLA